MVIFGTVASAKAKSNLAPCFIIPYTPARCQEESQGHQQSNNRYIKTITKSNKPVAFRAELLSRHPANTIG